MDDESKVVQLLTEIRDNQRAQMDVTNAALKRSHRGMRIVLVWLLLFLGFVIYFAYDANKKYEELKMRQEEALGKFEA
jgi:hypothetical protein